VGDGLVAARVSRYASFSIYLPIAAIVLLWSARSGRRWPTVMYACGVAVLMLLHGQVVSDSLNKMEYFNQSLRDGKLALRLHRIHRDDTLLAPLYPNTQRLLDRFDSLRRHGLLSFSAVDPQVLAHSEKGAQDPHTVCGFLDECSWIKPDLVACSGWAYLTHRKEPATNVILTWNEPNGELHPFALLPISLFRPDVANSLGCRRDLFCGFGGESRLPVERPQRVVIRGWTIDVEEGMACELGGAHPVRAGQFWMHKQKEDGPAPRRP
jgi:hypothetical protein